MDGSNSIPFALKYRPQTFDDIIGQPHVTATLKNAVSLQKIHHAYLFAGPRGVGKTSLARILAKALNCASGPTVTPCQSCDACQEITNGSSLDVLEIDGASNTGVDDVRALRENIRYLPAHGRWRITIVDEVHMLSQAAFNALLKTLEEPPPHAVFILATTESHKVPLTVVSRCHRFEFRRIAATRIVSTLQNIAKKETIQAADEVLSAIAQAAEGSVRDAESLLEQVAAFAGGAVTLGKVEELLGWAPEAVIGHILDAVIGRDPARCLEIVDRLFGEGKDLRRVAEAILETLRRSFVERHPSLGSVEDATLIRLFAVMYEATSQIARSPDPKIGLEVGLVKMSQLPLVAEIETVMAQLRGSRRESVAKERAKPISPAPIEAQTPPPPGEGHAGNWGVWLARLKERRPQIAAILEHGRLLKIDLECLEIGFPKGSIHLEMLKEREKGGELAGLIAELAGKPLTLRLLEIQDGLKEAPPPSPLEAPDVRNAIEILGAKVREVRKAP